MTFYKNSLDTWGNPESQGNFVKVPFTPMIFSFDGKNARVVGMKDPTDRLVQKLSDSKNLNDRQLQKKITDLKSRSLIVNPTGAEEYADKFIQLILAKLEELKYPNSVIDTLLIQFLKENQTIFAIIPDVDETNNRISYVERLPPYIIGARGQKTNKLPSIVPAVNVTNDGIPPPRPTTSNGGTHIVVMDNNLPYQFTFSDFFNSPLKATAMRFLLQLYRNINSIMTRTHHFASASQRAGRPITVAEMLRAHYYTLAFPFNQGSDYPLTNLALGARVFVDAANPLVESWSLPGGFATNVLLLDEVSRNEAYPGKKMGGFIKSFLIEALDSLQTKLPQQITSEIFHKITGLKSLLQQIDFNTQSSNYIKRVVIEHLLT